MITEKIFGIGNSKTGVTSLGYALVELGLDPCSGWNTSKHLIKYWMDGRYIAIFGFAKKYKSFYDAPWNYGDFYKLLNEKFPNSKFILTERDLDTWILSLKNHFTPSRKNKTDISYKFARVGLDGQAIHKMRYGISSRSIEGLEEQYKLAQKNRDDEIKKYFKGKTNFLVVNWEKGDGWKELCEFLEKPIPNIPFLHLNKTVNKVHKK